MLYLLFVIISALFIFAFILLFKMVLKPFLSSFDSRTVIIVFFFGLLFTCFIGGFFSKQNTSQAENRNLVKWKPLKETRTIDIPKQIDSYVNDHFGFRDKFIQIYRYFQFNVFGESLSERVVIGRNGWLFLNNAINACYTEATMTKDEIYKSKIIYQLRKFENILDERGIKLLIMIMPSKPNIYPENLPFWVNTKKSSRKTIDNFIDLVKAETSIPILDLYNSLIQTKKIDKSNLYYLNDTHWNSVGAFYAWKRTAEFFNCEGINYDSIDFNKYEIKNDSHIGDLCNMLGVQVVDNSPGYFTKTATNKLRIFLTKEACNVVGLNYDYSVHFKYSVAFKDINKSNTDTPVIIGDSFFLGSSFYRSIPFDKYYTMHYAEMAEGLPFLMKKQDDIDIVILSFVDREYNAFVKNIMRWDPDKQFDFDSCGWDKKLPY